MTKQTISRLKRIKKLVYKRPKLCKSNINNLLMYSITQIDINCFNKMILMGADIDKKQTYYFQQVKPIELILYEAAHCLYNKKISKFDTCLNFLRLIVKNGANINFMTDFFDKSVRDNAFMALFLYIKSITEEDDDDICAKSFVQLFLTMLELGANPNFNYKYQGADIDGWFNNLDLFCRCMLYTTYEEDAPYYLPLFQKFFVLGNSLLHNTATFRVIKSDSAYSDTLQMFKEWPTQMILYCLEQKDIYFL